MRLSRQTWPLSSHSPNYEMITLIFIPWSIMLSIITICLRIDQGTQTLNVMISQAISLDNFAVMHWVPSNKLECKLSPAYGNKFERLWVLDKQTTVEFKWTPVCSAQWTQNRVCACMDALMAAAVLHIPIVQDLGDVWEAARERYNCVCVLSTMNTWQSLLALCSIVKRLYCLGSGICQQSGKDQGDFGGWRIIKIETWYSSKEGPGIKINMFPN